MQIGEMHPHVIFLAAGVSAPRTALARIKAGALLNL